MDSSYRTSVRPIVFLLKEVKKMARRIRALSPFRIIALGFLLVILVGSLLLFLPLSRKQGVSVSYLDALFTATSAVCVTGLVVKDTASTWSLFGRSVLLLLIQVGGLGVVTAWMAGSLLRGKHISLHGRSLMQNASSAPSLAGIVSFTRFILLFTLCLEGLGALCLLPVFAGEAGMGRGVGYALFHSVSAFCNAGFDLTGEQEAFSSLVRYRGNVVVNLTIMLLIIVGGLGFATWRDLLGNLKKPRRLRLQTRLVLATSLILIVLPAVFFFFTEAAQGESLGERILLSLFQSVTTRTAGFATLDIGKLKEGSLLLMILLMIVGGSPGSTAGGIKTTTLAVVFFTCRSFFRKKRGVCALGRSLPVEVIWEAIVLTALYLGMLLVGGLFLAEVEDLPMMSSLFECASALGTVGLTTGITPGLSKVSQLLLIFLMFFGRLGGITFGFAAIGSVNKEPGRLPQESVMVG